MRLAAIVVLLLSALPVTASCGGGQKVAKHKELTARQIVERYKPAIVRIENDMGAQVAVGTGFIVSPDGRIATNLHVIVGGGALKVKLSDGSMHPVEKVIAIDAERDLALIKIDMGAEVKLPTVPLGDSDKVASGDAVVAIGNPISLDFTVSDGLISSVRPINDITLLQISAPISHGSSGGPLFNAYGEVIGVATLISQEGQNLNFGVPINYLRPLLAGTEGETVEEFAKHFEAPEDPQEIATPNGPYVRHVPQHEVAILDDCSGDQLVEVFTGINRAIELGAPLYNSGDHEACFRIYLATATHFEGDSKMCKGVRDAFGDGMLRTETQKSFTEKAWVMRDTFDGLLGVMVRKARAMNK